MTQAPQLIRWIVPWIFLAAAMPQNVRAQETKQRLDALTRIFEVEPAALEAATSDSLRILAEIQREGRRITPVSYPTISQQQCRAAAVLVFALATLVVEQRNWTEDVEIDVTCSGYRTTVVLEYPDSIELTDRELPGGRILYQKTHSRPPGVETEER